MEKKKFIYDLMLQYFVANDDLRPIMKNVHDAGNGYLYASDGHIAIRLKKEKTSKAYDTIEKYPNAEKIIQEAIDREGNKNAVIKTSDLIQILSEAAWRRVRYGDKCMDCDGSGTVECEHCGSDYDCKECNGKGTKNVRIRDFSLLVCEESNYCIKIGNLIFKTDFLYIIALMAQMLQVDEIQYLYKEKTQGGVFSFDGVDILLMPILSDNVKAVLTIK